MRSAWILLLSIALAGCASTRRSTVSAVPPATAERSVVSEAPATRAVETRYEVRAYRDANNPNVRHDAHAVYRSTRVPARVEALDSTPRATFAPVSYAPLPTSTELTAELAAQRQLTSELREIKSRMSAIEQQAQQQYGTLVTQTADTLKLRQQLEAERARVRELEAKLRDNAPSTEGAQAMATTAMEPKW
jgi:hypothetical protein